jgi:hypothetical protein
MHKTQVYLRQNQFKELSLLAKKLDKPYAGLIREALDHYLPKLKQKQQVKVNWRQRAEQVAAPMGGNVASNIDKELYS